MNRLFKYLMLGVIIALIGAVAMPIAAQDGVVEPAGPGEGGVIVQGNLGSDPSTFNPLIGNDATSSTVYGFMYPALIGRSVQSGLLEPMVDQAIAAGWEYDETGTILTIHIREDMFWSDGEQITADDWIWAADAVSSGLTTSPRTSTFYQLGTGTVVDGFVHDYTKVDDFTIELRIGAVVKDDEGNVVLNEDGEPELAVACDALEGISVAVVPEHAYSAQFGDDYAAMDADPYFYGGATFGPLNDPFMEFGVQVSLLADQSYTDTNALPYVSPGEWVYQVYADQNVGYERFLAGDFTIYSIGADSQNAFRDLADESGDFQYVESGDDGYVWAGLNLADPTNPQAGRDADGNPIDQGLHPIFGDVNVRLAFAHGIDVFEMIGTRPDGDNPGTGILEGNGFPVAVHEHPVFSPTREIYTELGVAPREYDPELAMSLLEEAGWVDTDGDGVRECQGCLYATEVDASFEGSPLTFTLITNAGNTSREAIGETIKANLDEIGFDVDFQAIEFGTLVDLLLTQTFDALILGWTGLSPSAIGDDLRGLFGYGADSPGSGFNFTSYANPEFNALLDEMDALPGCDQDTRNAGYAQAQYLMWQDAPYIWLYTGNVMTAAQGNLANFDPRPPLSTLWNIDDWVVIEE